MIAESISHILQRPYPIDLRRCREEAARLPSLGRRNTPGLLPTPPASGATCGSWFLCELILHDRVSRSEARSQTGLSKLLHVHRFTPHESAGLPKTGRTIAATCAGAHPDAQGCAPENRPCPWQNPAPLRFDGRGLKTSARLFNWQSVHKGRGRRGTPVSLSSATRSQPPRSAAAMYVVWRNAMRVASGSLERRTTS
jgi:hypothetical protein